MAASAHHIVNVNPLLNFSGNLTTPKTTILCYSFYMHYLLVSQMLERISNLH